MKKKNKSLKKKLMFGTAIAATSVIIGGSTLTPEDDFAGSLSNHEEIVTVYSSKSRTTAPVELPLVERILNLLPRTVRILFVVPLCIIFHLLLTVIYHLLLKVLSPLAASMIYWFLFICINLIIIVISVKAMFPSKPIKEILTQKCIISVISGTILIFICESLFSLYYPETDEIKESISYIGSMIIDVKQIYPYIKQFLTPRKQVRIQLPEEYQDIESQE